MRPWNALADTREPSRAELADDFREGETVGNVESIIQRAEEVEAAGGVKAYGNTPAGRGDLGRFQELIYQRYLERPSLSSQRRRRAPPRRPFR